MDSKNLPVIRYGTPILDGHLDAMYLDSYCYAEKPMENMTYSPLGWEGAYRYMSNTRGKSYYLYDDKYLYICSVVHDETLCSREKEWRMNTIWPWDDDGVESYVWFSHQDTFAVHSDAHNIRSVVDEHVTGEHHISSGKYHDTPRQDWAATIDWENKNYTVEIRIPLPDYVKAGSVIGTLLEIDDRFTADGPDTESMVGALVVDSHYAGDPKFYVRLEEKTM